MIVKNLNKGDRDVPDEYYIIEEYDGEVFDYIINKVKDSGLSYIPKTIEIDLEYEDRNLTLEINTKDYIKFEGE